MPLTDEEYRAGAIAHVNLKCGKTFIDGSLPPDVTIAVELITKAMKENPAVASQGLGDMSKSFFQNGTYQAAMQYLKPYRKAGFK